MIFAALIFGIGTGLISMVATLLAGNGLLAAGLAYVAGGWAGLLLVIMWRTGLGLLTQISNKQPEDARSHA